MNVLEIIYIYEETHQNSQLNDKPALSSIRMFETVVEYKHASYRQAPSTTYYTQQWISRQTGSNCQHTSYADYYVAYIYTESE